MSTPLARKVFELFGKPELAAEVERKQAAARPASAPATGPETARPHDRKAGEPRKPNYRSLYEVMVNHMPVDFHLIDSWLVKAYPALWRQIREIDDELVRLEQRGVPEAAYQTKLDELVAVCQEAQALREGHWGALLVKSELLGTEVWVIRDEGAMTLVKDDSRPVFFADEIALLKGKAPEQIKDILKAKAVFPGCRVVQ